MAKRGPIRPFKASNEPERPVRPRKYKYLFLIVCEDERTEPTYFKNFAHELPSHSLFIEVKGTGRDGLGVVQEAVKARDLLAANFKKEVDETWVVFDVDDAARDQAKQKRFDEAITLAKSEKLKTAISNEVFEVWLLLHLCDLDPVNKLHRDEIYSLLQEWITASDQYKSFVYNHGKTDILDIIGEIGDLGLAKSRAKKLEEVAGHAGILETNPLTQVHHLIEEIEGWIRYYYPD